MDNNEVFEVENTDLPVSNLLEKRRYLGKITDISSFVSVGSGNPCTKVEFLIENKRIRDFFPKIENMAWKWSQLMYAIGIRVKGKGQVTRERIVGQECLVDVGIKDRVLDDGVVVKENVIRGYSPIEEQTAPIAGVPPEEVQVQKPEPEKPPKTEEEVEKEIDEQFTPKKSPKVEGRKDEFEEI